MNLHMGVRYLLAGYYLRRPNWFNRRLGLAKGTETARMAKQDDRRLAIEYKTDGGWMFDSTCIEVRDMMADDWEIDHDSNDRT